MELFLKTAGCFRYFPPEKWDLRSWKPFLSIFHELNVGKSLCISREHCRSPFWSAEFASTPSWSIELHMRRNIPKATCSSLHSIYCDAVSSRTWFVMLMFYAETSGLLVESDYTKYMRRIVQATFKINIVGFTLLFFVCQLGILPPFTSLSKMCEKRRRSSAMALTYLQKHWSHGKMMEDGTFLVFELFEQSPCDITSVTQKWNTIAKSVHGQHLRPKGPRAQGFADSFIMLKNGPWSNLMPWSSHGKA